MPSYSLQGTGGVNCGPLVISQANGVTTITNNPPGGSGQKTVSGWTFTPATTNPGTIMNPNPGDKLNLGTYTVPIGTPPITYGFANDATFRAAASGVTGGYYYTSANSPTVYLPWRSIWTIRSRWG